MHSSTNTQIKFKKKYSAITMKRVPAGCNLQRGQAIATRTQRHNDKQYASALTLTKIYYKIRTWHNRTTRHVTFEDTVQEDGEKYTRHSQEREFMNHQISSNFTLKIRVTLRVRVLSQTTNRNHCFRSVSVCRHQSYSESASTKGNVENLDLY